MNEADVAALLQQFYDDHEVEKYDWLLYDWVQYLGPMGNNLVFIIMCLMGIALFVFSYKKQTDYIRKRVESYNKTK